MAATGNTNTEFELRGFNHIALVCRDMAETVAWYEDKLGMKLVKTLELPGRPRPALLPRHGQRRRRDRLLLVPEAPEGTPGDSLHPTYDDDMRRIGTAAAGSRRSARRTTSPSTSPPEKIDEYLVKLRGKGVAVTEITNHSNSLDGGHKADYDPATDDGDVFVRSLYFKDPNGTLLEFACWTTTFDESDVRHAPATAADAKVPANA